MTGTLAGALEARRIPHYPQKLFADAEGLIENIEGKPVITTVKIAYHITVPKGKREEAERAVAVHKASCAAAASVERSISVEASALIDEET